MILNVKYSKSVLWISLNLIKRLLLVQTWSLLYNLNLLSKIGSNVKPNHHTKLSLSKCMNISMCYEYYESAATSKTEIRKLICYYSQIQIQTMHFIPNQMKNSDHFTISLFNQVVCKLATGLENKDSYCRLFHYNFSYVDSHLNFKFGYPRDLSYKW